MPTWGGNMLELRDLESTREWLEAGSAGRTAAVRDVDLRALTGLLTQRKFKGCLFVGCDLEPDAASHILDTGGVVVADQTGFKFAIHRSRCYSPDELFAGFEPDDPKGGFKKTYDYA